jgi:hypothetical protein
MGCHAFGDEVEGDEYFLESFGSKWVRRSLTLPWGKTANCCLGTIYPCQGAADVVTVIT